MYFVCIVCMRRVYACKIRSKLHFLDFIIGQITVFGLYLNFLHLLAFIYNFLTFLGLSGNDRQVPPLNPHMCNAHEGILVILPSKDQKI